MRVGVAVGPPRRCWALLLTGAALLLAVRLLLMLPRPRQQQQEAAARRAAVIRHRLHAEPVRNNHTYSALHLPTGGCAPDTRLLILVSSAFNNWNRRQAVRDTWGAATRLRGLGARLLFLLGRSRDDPQEMVDAEAAEYEDVLQQDFLDSYGNLTLKTMMGLRWASQYCENVAYVVKTDDDIFWNVPLLQSHLDTIQEDRIITGCIKQYSAPEPISFQGLPSPPGHPLFTAGAGYVMSGSLTGDLYEASRRVRLLPIEDVFITGYCAKLAWAWPPKHHKGFSCGGMATDDCDLVQMFNAHKISPERQYLIWEKFTSDPNPCMDF